LWEAIEKLDNKVPADVQLGMLEQARRTIRRASRWYLRHGDKSIDINRAIAEYCEVYRDLRDNLADYLVEEEYQEVETEIKSLVSQGVPEDIARSVASFSNMFCSLDLAQIARTAKRGNAVAATLYYQLGSKLELHWFLDQINHQSVSNHWQALARASYREELDWQQRSIANSLLMNAPDEKDAHVILNTWMDSNEVLLQRWYHMMSEFKTSTTHDFAKFSVALRELMLLSVKANH
jgi:glutamate dehydrogenase